MNTLVNFQSASPRFSGQFSVGVNTTPLSSSATMLMRKCDFKTFTHSLSPDWSGEERTSRRPAPGIRRLYGYSRWGSLTRPQMGEFGWPPGMQRRRLRSGRVPTEIGNNFYKSNTRVLLFAREMHGVILSQARFSSSERNTSL